jgi:hypothetical protein
MQHQNPDLDFDDTRIILQGASCILKYHSSTSTYTKCDYDDDGFILSLEENTIA